MIAVFVMMPCPIRLYALRAKLTAFLIPYAAAPLPCPQPMRILSADPPKDGSFAIPYPVLTKYCMSCIVLSMRSVDLVDTPWALAASPTIAPLPRSKHWSRSAPVIPIVLWKIRLTSNIRFLHKTASSQDDFDFANCSGGMRLNLRQCCSRRSAKINLLNQLKSASSRHIARSLVMRRLPKTFSNNTVMEDRHLDGEISISRATLILVT